MKSTGFRISSPKIQWFSAVCSKRNFDIQRNLGISAQIAQIAIRKTTTSPQIAVLVFAALPPLAPLPLQRDYQGPGPAVSAAVGLPWAEKVGTSDQGLPLFRGSKAVEYVNILLGLTWCNMVSNGLTSIFHPFWCSSGSRAFLRKC